MKGSLYFPRPLYLPSPFPTPYQRIEGNTAFGPAPNKRIQVLEVLGQGDLDRIVDHVGN